MASEATSTKPIEALFRPALVLMTGRLIGLVVAFAIPMVLARVFDQTEFGTYKQIFLVFGTLFGIAQLGMAESLYYFLPSRAEHAGRFVLNTLIVAAVLGLCSLVSLWLFRNDLANLMNNPALIDLVLPLGLYLTFMLMAVVLEIVMTVRRQFGAASTAYALTDVGRAAFYLVPVLLVADLRVLMLGAVVFAMVRLLVTLVYLRREFGPGLKPDRRALFEQARYAVPLGLAGIIGIVQSTLHLYAVSYTFDTATFAIYAVGCLQIPLSHYLVTSTGNVMMVNLRERVLDEDREGALAVWLDAIRKLAMIFFPMTVGLLVMAHPFIVFLFTDSYAASVPIFMVWTLSLVLAFLMTDAALRVYALTRFLIVQKLLSLGLMLLFLQGFMDRFGPIGAVMASLLAATLVKGLALERTRRALEVSPARMLPWRAMLVSAALAVAAALPAWGVLRSMDAAPLLQLMVAGPVYLLTYTLLLRSFGPLQADEKQQLGQWIQRPFLWLRRAA